MHGGAVTLAREFQGLDFQPDLLLATDMLDLTTFLALSRRRTAQLPTVLYLHENQLTYPLPEDPEQGPMRRQRGERDLHYAFINYASMLTANHIVFNSEFQRSCLFDQLPSFLNHFPEFREEQTLDQLRSRSSVLSVGLDLKCLESNRTGSRQNPPLILWNQRWEYDKNPEGFFETLLTLAGENIPFEVALCGESFQQQPKIFASAIQTLGNRVMHQGYAQPELYHRLLWESTLTFSTAIHEFFGISILEAALCETLPFLPNRLSYPELLPTEFHARCLYDCQEGLLQHLRWSLAHPEETRRIATTLASRIRTFDWECWAPEYDRLLEKVRDAASGSSR